MWTSRREFGDLLRSAGGVLLAAGAVVLVARKPGGHEWAWIGASSQSLPVAGAFAAAGLMAGYGASRARVPYGTLLAALASLVAWLTIWSKILHPTADTLRVLLIAGGALLLLSSVVLRRAEAIGARSSPLSAARHWLQQGAGCSRWLPSDGVQRLREHHRRWRCIVLKLSVDREPPDFPFGAPPGIWWAASSHEWDSAFRLGPIPARRLCAAAVGRFAHAKSWPRLRRRNRHSGLPPERGHTADADREWSEPEHDDRRLAAGPARAWRGGTARLRAI